MIRQDKEIKGYNVVDSEIRISQYADDTSLFLDGSEESFNKCVHLILEYAKFSGLAMNFDKTKVIWFGSPRPPDEVYLPHLNFEWNPPKFDILGVEFTTSLANITDINIEKKIIGIQKEINNWTNRDLTPFGKIVVIKSLLLAKIVHILISLPTPSGKLIRKLNCLFFNFLWDNKPDKIKRSIAMKKLEKGGISMIDLSTFDKSLKLTWLRRFMLNEPKRKLVVNNLFPGLYDFWRYDSIFLYKISENINN